MIKLVIDDIQVEVEEGTTILEAARKVNINIPTLCFLKDINEVGDCRMCIVEVEGRKGFATSCIQKVEEGMIVHTNTPEVMEARKMVLDLETLGDEEDEEDDWDALFDVEQYSAELILDALKKYRRYSG